MSYNNNNRIFTWTLKTCGPAATKMRSNVIPAILDPKHETNSVPGRLPARDSAILVLQLVFSRIALDESSHETTVVAALMNAKIVQESSTIGRHQSRIFRGSSFCCVVGGCQRSSRPPPGFRRDLSTGTVVISFVREGPTVEKYHSTLWSKST